MRLLKVYFLVVLSLLAYSFVNLARAESIPALVSTNLYIVLDHPPMPWSDVIAYVNPLCTGRFNDFDDWIPNTAGPATTSANFQYVYCSLKSRNFGYVSGSNAYTGASKYVGYYCPDSSWVLDGATCTRPDCPAGSSRLPDGSCEQKCPDFGSESEGSENCTCPDGEKKVIGNWCRKLCGDAVNNPNMYQSGYVQVNAGWPVFFPGGSDSACMTSGHLAGCLIQSDSGSFEQVEGGRYQSATSTGFACSADPENPVGNEPIKPEAKPVAEDDLKPPDPECGPNQGVITSSNGNVLCLDEKLPGAKKPVVEKRQRVEVSPTGEQTLLNEVVTRDPSSGAQITQQTETGPGGTKTTTETRSVSGVDGDGKGGGGTGGDGDCEGEDCGDGEGGGLGQKGSFGDASNEIAEAKAAFAAEFNLIRSEAADLFSGSSAGGGGSLPCPPPVSVLGVDFSICLSDYADDLGLIALAIMAMAYVSAAFILLRA